MARKTVKRNRREDKDERFEDLRRRRQESRKGSRRSKDSSEYVEHVVDEEFKVGDVIFEKGDTLRIYPKVQETKKKFKEINSRDAREIDTNAQGQVEVYVDYDDDAGAEGVFGINSGFMYASPSNPERWIMNHPNFIEV